MVWLEALTVDAFVYSVKMFVANMVFTTIICEHFALGKEAFSSLLSYESTKLSCLV
jgi:hypothetical protein